MRLPRRLLVVSVLLCPLAILACTSFSSDGPADNGDASTAGDGAAPEEAIARDGSIDACKPDLANDDPLECGGCGARCASGHCSDGGCEPLIFTTSSAYGGNLGGTAGADEICAGVARDAKLAGRFRAFLAEGDAQPPAATFVKSHRPYWALGGDGGAHRVAADFDALGTTLTGSLDFDAKGFAVVTARGRAWCNVNASGSQVAVANCDDWRRSDGGSNGGAVGLLGAIEPNKWAFASAVDDCAKGLPIRCFEQADP